MPYTRYDQNNELAVPQPNSNTVTVFDGTEGWSEIEYMDWNADYIARNDDNTPRTIGTYQRYDDNGDPVAPLPYQRHDENCDPISE